VVSGRRLLSVAGPMAGGCGVCAAGQQSGCGSDGGSRCWSEADPQLDGVDLTPYVTGQRRMFRMSVCFGAGDRSQRCWSCRGS
jgi:hypothetical protein